MIIIAVRGFSGTIINHVLSIIRDKPLRHMATRTYSNIYQQVTTSINYNKKEWLEMGYKHFKLWRDEWKWPFHAECDFAMIGKEIRYVSLYPHSLTDVANLDIIFTDGSRVMFRLIDYRFL